MSSWNLLDCQPCSLWECPWPGRQWSPNHSSMSAHDMYNFNKLQHLYYLAKQSYSIHCCTSHLAVLHYSHVCFDCKKNTKNKETIYITWVSEVHCSMIAKYILLIAHVPPTLCQDTNSGEVGEGVLSWEYKVGAPVWFLEYMSHV